MELYTVFSLFLLLISATTFLAELKAVEYSRNQVDLGANPTTFTECSLTNFSNGQSCSLTCSVDYTGDSSSNYVFHSSAFYYYTTDSSDTGMIQISHFDTFPSDKIAFTLTSTDYFAGFYVCRIVLRSISERELVTYSHTFQIDPYANGANLKDDCNWKQECLALNATCDDGKCKCLGKYYMQYSKASDTVACLSDVLLGEHGCHIDDQCQATNIEATCEDGECIRTNHNRFTPAEVSKTVVNVGAVLGFLTAIVKLAQSYLDRGKGSSKA